jgi:hypothetical protein
MGLIQATEEEYLALYPFNYIMHRDPVTGCLWYNHVITGEIIWVDWA